MSKLNISFCYFGTYYMQIREEELVFIRFMFIAGVNNWALSYLIISPWVAALYAVFPRFELISFGQKSVYTIDLYASFCWRTIDADLRLLKKPPLFSSFSGVRESVGISFCEMCVLRGIGTRMEEGCYSIERLGKSYWVFYGVSCVELRPLLWLKSNSFIDVDVLQRFFLGTFSPFSV